MSNPTSNAPATAVGQLALHRHVAPELPEPYARSFVASTARRSVETPDHSEEFYPLQYATDGSLIENLRFAFKNEPLDLRIVCLTLRALGGGALAEWLRREPTGVYSRRAWFLYEKLTGGTIDYPDVTAGNYVDALDACRHYVSTPVNSRRHRVRDNLLGGPRLCPVVRRTPRLQAFVGADLSHESKVMAAGYSSDTIARAVSFLYTKETRSSFAIEGETPGRHREERFVRALHDAPRFLPANKRSLVELQSSIVDPRYAARDWRDFQNFVGETTKRFGEFVHFVCPRPEDVASLMDGWLDLTERLRLDALDPVIAAAVSAFAFVFIHPFEDGNGRIHRFLIHAFLASRRFGPPGIIFPVSAAILRERSLYDHVLESFSKPLMAAIDWDFTDDQALLVRNETLDLYRFFDATAQAEFLYERIAETIRVDLKEEADFLERFDAALDVIANVVEMPDKRASLLARYCLSSAGRLSNNKRKQFDELSDAEVASIEKGLQGLLARER